ncbi:MAG: coenzyme transferase family protein [Variovorax sp.]|nr:coenzyme transferase family protein [Variovorax sp.]
MTFDTHTPIDFASLLRPGDGIVFGQACSEPRTLTECLVRQADQIVSAVGKPRVFIAGSYSGLFEPALGDCFDFASYGAIGDGAALARAGCLDLYPTHYSQLTRLFDSGQWRCDVVLMQVSPADASGRHSMGLANDFQLAAARHARVVIAEVNAQVPWTFGAELPDGFRIDHRVQSDRPPVEAPAARGGATADRIAEHVADLVPEGATLQMGVGGVMNAICRQLQSHRGLGVHSGIVSDGIAELMLCGAVDNSRKTGDAGVTVAGSLFGSRKLFDFADRNPAFRLAPTHVTHGPAVLAGLHRLCAINSAVEVDLSGQVNAEVSGGHYVGAVGGQVDFLHAAALSEGGRAIVALPSTAAGGTISRIVPLLDGVPTTTARSDVDCIVTEWGVAMLRGLNLRERAQAMVRIAHPDFREPLSKAAHRRAHRSGAM